jgi:hypothetical protein
VMVGDALSIAARLRRVRRWRGPLPRPALHPHAPARRRLAGRPDGPLALRLTR